MKSIKRHERRRTAVQLLSALLFNGYIPGFINGKIYNGKGKLLCIPVLNCYSCPGALGSCPIGALQSSAAAHRFPFYVLGTLLLFGTVLGRLVCGFLCPFGLIQELLHRIPVKKLSVPKKADMMLRFVKYAVLALFVFVLPVLAVNSSGLGDSWFCKYICPAGTLEAALPHVLFNEQLRELADKLFTLKTLILVLTAAGAVLIHRAFCRYLCPLGAFWSLFNRFALYRMSIDGEKCTSCGKCAGVCPMSVRVTENINSSECIRCGRCKAACPNDAISSGFEMPFSAGAASKKEH